jgi:probable HAF family extracellular repeat protein
VVRDLGVRVIHDESDDGTLSVAPNDPAINERGQVAGTSTTAAGYSRAFLWEDGRVRDLGVLPGDTNSGVVAINDRGQVVGTSWTYATTGAGHPFPGHAFLWENGRMRDLGVLPGSDASEPVGINRYGQITGTTTYDLGPWRAVIWQGGKMKGLGTLPGANDSQAAAINDAGQIAGSSGGSAFVWQNGRMRELGNLPGYSAQWVNGINDLGQIVGSARSPAQNALPVLWQKGEMRLFRLSTLWEPLAINDRGQVVLNFDNEWILWQGGSVRHRGIGEAKALNEHGQVAIEDSDKTVPLIWQNGKTTRLPLLPGDEGGAALALNERNQIVGISGTLEPHTSGAVTDYPWDCHIVLWTWQPA